MTQLREGARLVAGCVAFVLAAQPAGALAQDRVQLNSVSRVELKGATVEIVGSRKPSFTTFTLSDPPRLVIDLSEAVFVDVPREQRVGAAGIVSIKTSTFGSEAAAIARVLINFEQELETELASDGATLIVKLPPDPGEKKRLAQARLEAERQARLQREAEERARVEAEAAEAERRRQELAEAKARAEAERVAKLEAEKVERERKRREAEEARARAEAERVAKLEAEKAEREQRRREAEEARARAEAERVARLEAERTERERQRQEAEARAEAARVAKLEAEKAEREQKRREAEEAKARAEAELQARREAEAAERERQRREAEAAQAQAEAQRLAREAAQERARLEAAEATARAEAARVAALEAERQRRQRELEAAAASTPSPAELAASGRRARVTFVGFKQSGGVGRIFLRMTAPVRYSLGEEGPRTVVVTLEKAVIELPNTQRILDTSFFDTAVSLVKPESIDGERVRVTVTLKRAVPYRANLQGNELVLEFERPE